MSFNASSGVFHCFSCGSKGGTIEFAHRLTGKTGHVDALLALADIWQVTLPSELRQEAERTLDRKPELSIVVTRPPTPGPTLSTARADGRTPMGVEPVRPSTHARWGAYTTGTVPPEPGPILSTAEQLSLTHLGPGRNKPAAHFLLELVKAWGFQAPPPMKFTLLVQEGRGEMVSQPMEAGADGAEREETEDELDARAPSQIPTDASSDTISIGELRQWLHVGKEKVQGTVQRLMAAGHVMRVQNRGLRRTWRSSSAQEGNSL